MKLFFLAVFSIIAAGCIGAPAADFSGSSCTLNSTDGQCVFINSGSAAGSACVTVALQSISTGLNISSATVCSGNVPSGGEITVPAQLSDSLQLCEDPYHGGCRLQVYGIG